MRVLLNGLAVFGAGSQTYFSNLIPYLGRLASEHEFVLLCSPWQDILNFELPPNFRRLVAGPKWRSVPLRVLWEQVRLPSMLRQGHFDVMFSPTPATTLFGPCPVIIAVRNPNVFLTLSEKNWRYQARNFLLRVVTQLAAERATAVVFVSNYSREAALKSLKIDANKAAVIHHGTGPHFFLPARESTSRLLNITRPYLLTVSTIQTHKNYPRMIEAFGRLCGESDLGYDYVIAGSAVSRNEFHSVQACIDRLNLRGRVHYLGQVPYQELPALYQKAILFVLPSLLETFGHPLVEAMASGIPIVASRTAAVPEIADSAAVYFDPYDVNNMAATLRHVLQNRALRTELAAAGRKRASCFSWESTARKLLQLFETAVSDSH